MFDDFATYLQGQDRSAKTARSYLSDLRQFATWFQQTNGEAMTPQAVTPTDLREYREYMLITQRLAASTINRRLAALSTYLAWGIEIGVLEYNPAQKVKGVGKHALAPKWLTKTDQGRLERTVEVELQNARTEPAKRGAKRDYALIMLMLHTGLRAGEVCALTLGDVTISDRKGQVIVQAGKGSKQRTLPLNQPIRKALTSWLQVRPASEHRQVFLGQRGDALTESALRRILEALSRRANVDASPHTLRHTFGKRLVDNGVTLEKVAALMGHSSLNTTRMYLTPGQQDLERAVETLA